MSAAFLGNITDGIGHTPLVRLNRLSPPGGATIYGKAEFYNPGGSVKDRICLNMINGITQIQTDHADKKDFLEEKKS